MMKVRLGAVVLMPIAAAIVGSTAPVDAQVVDGVLVDGRNGLPVPDVFVQLVDESDVVHDTARTNRSGRFVMTARTAGSYVVSAEREAYAGLLSDAFELQDGRTLAFRMELVPISLENMRQISEVMDTNARLRNGVVELCRGRMDPASGGILLGVVRDRITEEPVSGAVATMVLGAGCEVEVTTALTDRQGAYVFCYAPRSDSLEIRVEAEGYRPASQEVEIRSGTISWYDFRMRR